MTFPVMIHVFGVSLHPHAALESLGYIAGFQTFLALRRRERQPAASAEGAMWILVGCVAGALLGSKVLAWVESWPDYWQHRDDWRVWIGGKTIVGGLIGGWAGVEIAKRALGIRRRTGDTYALPLCIGIAIGRIGCFLTGLDDHTHGTPSNLPWAVNFGDGVPRHPTQLYEIVWLMIVALGLWFLPRTRGRLGGGQCREHSPSAEQLGVVESNPATVAPSLTLPRACAGEGTKFRLFLAAYMLFRFAIECIKPSWKGYAGLSAIQWASLVTAIFAIISLRKKPNAAAAA